MSKLYRLLLCLFFSTSVFGTNLPQVVEDARETIRNNISWLQDIRSYTVKRPQDNFNPFFMMHTFNGILGPNPEDHPNLKLNVIRYAGDSAQSVDALLRLHLISVLDRDQMIWEQLDQHVTNIATQPNQITLLMNTLLTFHSYAYKEAERFPVALASLKLGVNCHLNIDDKLEVKDTIDRAMASGEWRTFESKTWEDLIYQSRSYRQADKAKFQNTLAEALAAIPQLYGWELLFANQVAQEEALKRLLISFQPFFSSPQFVAQLVDTMSFDLAHKKFDIKEGSDSSCLRAYFPNGLSLVLPKGTEARVTSYPYAPQLRSFFRREYLLGRDADMYLRFGEQKGQQKERVRNTSTFQEFTSLKSNLTQEKVDDLKNLTLYFMKEVKPHYDFDGDCWLYGIPNPTVAPSSFLFVEGLINDLSLRDNYIQLVLPGSDLPFFVHPLEDNSSLQKKALRPLQEFVRAFNQKSGSQREVKAIVEDWGGNQLSQFRQQEAKRKKEREKKQTQKKREAAKKETVVVKVKPAPIPDVPEQKEIKQEVTQPASTTPPTSQAPSIDIPEPEEEIVPVPLVPQAPLEQPRRVANYRGMLEWKEYLLLASILKAKNEHVDHTLWFNPNQVRISQVLRLMQKMVEIHGGQLIDSQGGSHIWRFNLGLHPFLLWDPHSVKGRRVHDDYFGYLKRNLENAGISLDVIGLKQ